MDFVGVREVEFLEVGAVAATVDDQKVLRLSERRQHAVPEIAEIVDALPRCGDEGMRLARPVPAVRADDDQERTRRQRYESLAAQGVALHQGQLQRYVIGRAAPHR